jgi:RNA polymerase primary sigma factor
MVHDLIQEGSIGLMRAVDTWDASKGEFRTHILANIRYSIIKHLKDNHSLIRVNKSPEQRRILGRMVRGEDIEGQAADEIRAASNVLSISSPLHDDRGGTATVEDVLIDSHPNPEEQCIMDEYREMAEAICVTFRERLKPKEKPLWNDRMCATDPSSLEAIANREGITREAVRQREQIVMKRFERYVWRCRAYRLTKEKV